MSDRLTNLCPASRALVGAILASLLLVGCGRGELPLVKAGGVVKYKGEPVPGATVTFISDSNPLAVGATNEQGEFELNTLGREGAAVGPYRVTVIALKDSREITPEEAQTIQAEELSRIRKSLIPEKYGDPRTGGLTQTISKNPTENRFTLDLTD